MRTGAYATAPNLEPSSVVSAACTIELPATSAEAEGPGPAQRQPRPGRHPAATDQWRSERIRKRHLCRRGRYLGLRHRLRRRKPSLAPEADRPLRPRRIDHHSALRHHDLSGRDQPPRRSPGALHERLPILRGHNARRLRRADRLPCPALLQQLQDCGFERRVHVARLLAPASVAAIADVLPVPRPLFAPFDSTAAGRACLRFRFALDHNNSIFFDACDPDSRRAARVQPRSPSTRRMIEQAPGFG